MSKLKVTHEWWTSPAEAENGNLIMVTGRTAIDAFASSGRYPYRVTVTWRYTPDGQGMPDTPTSRLMDEVNEALNATFDAHPSAIVTGIYTGDSERNWVVYTTHLEQFQRLLNEALKDFDNLPLTFEAAHDPQWEEYAEMRQLEVDTSD